jgi:hypothetical protein
VCLQEAGASFQARRTGRGCVCGRVLALTAPARNGAAASGSAGASPFTTATSPTKRRSRGAAGTSLPTKRTSQRCFVWPPG